MQPYAPSFGTLDGSCGYGLMDKTAYPYWSVVGNVPAAGSTQGFPARAVGEQLALAAQEQTFWHAPALAETLVSIRMQWAVMLRLGGIAALHRSDAAILCHEVTSRHHLLLQGSVFRPLVSQCRG